jgi:cytochrome b involved in lipid metabolism
MPLILRQRLLSHLFAEDPLQPRQTMPSTKKYSYKDLEAHSERGNLWIVIHGKVHDASKFYLDHP